MKLGPRGQKVWHDVWSHKARTFLVVLAIIVGVYAVGIIIGIRSILNTELTESYLATNPSSAVFYVDAFDADFLTSIRQLDSVADAEGRVFLQLSWQAGPEDWQIIKLIGIDDYNDIRLNTVTLESGDWPPPQDSLLIERSSLKVMEANVSDTLLVEAVDGQQHELTITGIVHDVNQLPSPVSGQVYGYLAADELERLELVSGFNELRILVNGNEQDKEHIQQVVEEVRSRIEESGRIVYSIEIPEPGVHPSNNLSEPLIVILGFLGVATFLAGPLLVVNTLNALLLKQVNQIGIMKSIGATTSQIAWMYFLVALTFGLLGLLIAIPLSAVTIIAISNVLADAINFNLEQVRLPFEMFAAQIFIGAIVPLLATIYPVYRGASITVHEAISNYGLSDTGFGNSFLDRGLTRLTSKLPQIPQSARIALRNMARRKERLALTFVTLTVGGAIFVSILSVYDSFRATSQLYFDEFNYDVFLNFEQHREIEDIRREVLSVPGVVAVDSWARDHQIRRLRSNGTESENMTILGLAPDTDFFKPTIVDGRWLTDDDTNAVVISTEVLQDETDIEVGDTITLKMNERTSEWRVVGVFISLNGKRFYTNQTYLAPELGLVGLSNEARIRGENHDAASQQELSNRLRKHFETLGINVTPELTSDIREQIEDQFNIVQVSLLSMATLLGVVNILGLMGTMTINILERTREFGVMRAIGASNKTILSLVIIEGMFMALLSWVASLILAYPFSRILSTQLGNAFMNVLVIFRFAASGLLIWLVIVLIIAALGSVIPAWNASRLSTWETLNYE